jgi:hypothetical protein
MGTISNVSATTPRVYPVLAYIGFCKSAVHFQQPTNQIGLFALLVLIISLSEEKQSAKSERRN